jgi:hypothetical protein
LVLQIQKIRGKILIAAGFTCFGERVKDIDVVAFGQFEKGFSCQATLNGSKQRVYINNFCFCIEVKDHPPEDIRFQGFTAMVRYKGSWSDATGQSKKQIHALNNFLRDTVNWSPFICSFIWFRNLQMEDLEQTLRNLVSPETITNLHSQHNWLPSDFPIDFLFGLAFRQKTPFKPDGRNYYGFSCVKRDNADEICRKIEEAHSIFTRVQQNIGKLTRDRLEKITKEAILKDQRYVQAIGKKLVVIRGRAGTGKTIKLIHIAYDLCRKQVERCLILTYNKALVSDIRRTIALAKVKTDLDEATVEVQSVHAFMLKLLVGFGVYRDEVSTSFLENYEELKDELLALLEQGARTREDVERLMLNNREELSWEKILIDEGQDWPENERQILFKVFYSKNFIVADGVDQLIRGQIKTDWTKGVDHHRPPPEKRSLRQKANLCRFENQYAELVGIDWQIEPKTDFSGGKILITGGPYSEKLHRRLVEACEKDGNKPYEMLFLVPPSLVEKQSNRRHFVLADQWSTWGISLWDGTLSDTRTEYPRDVKQHRLLQYDSCRGLEGWIVVSPGSMISLNTRNGCSTKPNNLSAQTGSTRRPEIGSLIVGP